MTTPTPPPTGGPAFPIGTKEIRIDTYGGGRSESSYGWEGGMTLRDYFAAKAMQGLLSDSNVCQGVNSWPSGKDAFNVAIAASAYRKADAMLAAREAK